MNYLKEALDSLYELENKIGMEFHNPQPRLFMSVTHGYILAELCEIGALVNHALDQIENVAFENESLQKEDVNQVLRNFKNKKTVSIKYLQNRIQRLSKKRIESIIRKLSESKIIMKHSDNCWTLSKPQANNPLPLA